MTFLVSRRLERNNVWGPTDRPIDRSLHVGEREEVVAAWLRDADAFSEERDIRVHVYMCVCVLCAMYAPGSKPTGCRRTPDARGKEDGDEGERERDKRGNNELQNAPVALYTFAYRVPRVRGDV